MFTDTEMDLIQAALDMNIASNKRAMNSKHNPAFKPIYLQLEKDLTTLKVKLHNINKPPSRK